MKSFSAHDFLIMCIWYIQLFNASTMHVYFTYLYIAIMIHVEKCTLNFLLLIVVGWVSKPKVGPPCHQATDSGAVPSRDDKNVHKPQDRLRWWLAAVWTQPILISAPQWANMPCNAPTWFYRVCEKLSVKADLAIYSHAVDVSGQCI